MPGDSGVPAGGDAQETAHVVYTRRKLTPAQIREAKACSRMLRGRKAGPRRPPNTVHPRLAIYERVSEGDDDSASMYRQRMENMEFAASLGAQVDWVNDVYYDYNVSAAGGHLRQGLEDLMNAIEEGQYDGVLSWEIPRIVRDENESEILRMLMLDNSCELYIGTHRDLSLWGATAPMFPLMVKIAAGEVQAQSRRTASWHKRMSVHGTVRCQPPFGMKSTVSSTHIDGRVSPLKLFAPDWEPREELGGLSRGDLVQEAARVVAGGLSATKLAHEWNARGWRAGRGGKWSAGALTRILRSPKIAGVAHRGDFLLDVDGNEVPKGSELDADLKFVNDALIPFADWFQLQRLLAGRKDAASRRVDGERVLRGLLGCGRCGFRATACGRSFRCDSRQYESGGCGGNTINAEFVEQFVVGIALGVVKNLDLRACAASANEPERIGRIVELEAESARLLQRLSRVVDAYADIKETHESINAQYLEKRGVIDRDLARVGGALRRLHQQSRLRLSEELAKAADVDATWAAMPTHQQNSILDELITKVWIDPAVARSNEVDENRIRIDWAIA